MTLVPPKIFRPWIVIALACTAFVWCVDGRRLARVDYVTALAQESASGAVSPPKRRELIVPERAEPTYQWLAQTGQMLAKREWRVRRVGYDNAPFGRDVPAPSPYRWWLGVMAAADHLLTGSNTAAAVEWAARHADPLLHLMALWGATTLVAWGLGSFAACFCALGIAALFPFAAGFVPGVADHHALAGVLALGTLLAPVIALRRPERLTAWMAVGGVLGGLTLWVDVPTAVPVLLGAAFGGLLAGALGRKVAEPAGMANAWRIWGLTGAVTVLLAYFLEYAPDTLGGWHLETVHPIYGVAWVGAAELVTLMRRRMRPRPTAWDGATVILALAALVALTALPMAMRWAGSRGFLATDVLSVRLANIPGAQAAGSLEDLFKRPGAGAQLAALLLPLFALVPAAWALISRPASTGTRQSIAFALGPALVLFAFACRELALFRVFDAALLVLVVAAAVPPATNQLRAGWGLAAGALVLPGLLQVVPPRFAGERTALTRMEAEELIERDIARWLALHAGERRAIVYAPPHVSTTLCYYGDLRGIGSFDPDNRAGFGAALAIAGARTMEEVQASIQARGIRYIVIPTWDPFFDEFASRYLAKNFSNRSSFFVAELRAWHLPLWLRPVAYEMPVIPGFERDSVRVFEVVDEQRPAAAASRLVEYLAEVGLAEDAAAFAESLRRFPGDCGALSTRALVLKSRGDEAGFAQAIQQVKARLALNGDRYLAWDRRVCLSTVLAQADELDLARLQVRRCVKEASDARLRSLSTGGLYRLLVLSQSFQLPFADARLHDLAVSLLPAELRAKL